MFCVIETEGWASSSLWRWERGGKGDPKRARASSKDPPWHQPVICSLVCDWQVFGGSLQKILQVPWLSLWLLKLTWRSCSGFCSYRSLEVLMLGSLPQTNLAHAVAKLSCVGKTKPTNRPASHSLYQLHQIWMLPMPVSHTTHHWAKPRILTKISSLL